MRPVGLADCRRCVYFKPADSMSPGELEQAYGWVNANRPGARLLGYCLAYQRPVTYYVGSCRGFTGKPLTPSRSLEEFFPELRG